MEQMNRAHRYLERMRAQYEGVDSARGSKQQLLDDVISFFMHCHHIRDWIVHLNKVGVTSRQVDAFIDAHPELQVCADLCNGSKHCKLDRTIRSGRQPHIAGETYRKSTWLTGDGGICIVQCRYTILTATGPIDALALAEKCMKLWNEYVGQLRPDQEQV
ncbi:hypothetical protein [Oleiagrimonas soli]|uniref:Uncharacterized protein n=1 Tax=Oleiagrimonas soli TaxID=1543381 RepID=A0A099CTD2_9GAMM|nr:hypothetical protein [Oleiagrimonas soli]KGI76887.1 hypothetical protein LF63_0113250 [Oleiagrimonas soli]MBB6185257.1 hypothetical protein [Oleiagrimonas soli]